MNNNGDLRKEIRRGINLNVLIFLIVGFSCVIKAFSFDLLKKAGVVTNKSAEMAAFLGTIKDKLSNNIDQYCNMVMTLDTILAAAVIFFYSIQDSRKGGIPHRTILAYTLGAFTVPVLFVVTLLMLPFCYMAQSFNLNWTVCVSLLFTYIIQMMIVVFILVSTSYQYSVYAITNVEIRQFKAMSDQEDVREQDAQEGNQESRQEKVEQNPFFTWTYLQHHLEQITLSDELVADKLLLARRILRVPYYEREILLREEMLRPFRMYEHNLQMSAERLGTVRLKNIYEFYYGNLLAVFNHIKQPKDSEYRDKIYLILYEFLEELTELYEEMKRKNESIDKHRENYLMTISGIINAVLSSNVEESEAFSNYVFNHIVSKDMWDTQIGLYIVYRKYLYAKDNSLSKYTKANLTQIVDINKWKSNIDENKNIYIAFWMVWMEFTTISLKDSYNYLYETLKVLQGDRTGTDPITYNMLAIELAG